MLYRIQEPLLTRLEATYYYLLFREGNVNQTDGWIGLVQIQAFQSTIRVSQRLSRLYPQIIDSRDCQNSERISPWKKQKL